MTKISLPNAVKESAGSGTLYRMFSVVLLATLACPPAAQVEGDEPLAGEIRGALAARGIESESELPCPAVYATVHHNGEGLVAVLRDDSGHERSYEIRDRATAVTIVESWARHDLEDALLGRSRPAPATPPAKSRLPISVALLSGTAHGTEGSIWSDAAISGSLRIGGVCAGALARTSQDSGEYGDADRYDTFRTAIDLLATVDGSKRYGRWGIGAGLGFGVGWTRSTPERRVAGAHEEATGLRLESRATGSFALARGLDLTFTLTAGVSPLAREGKIRENGAIFAGEPRGWLRPSLGLRYGQ